jgi:hypothetical protein
MGSRPIVALIASAAAANCTSKGRTEFVPLPPVPVEAKSLVVCCSGSTPFALAIGSDQKVEIPLSVGFRSTLIEAAALAEPLSDLGLAEGPLMPSGDLVPLPAGLGDFSIEVVEAQPAPSEWMKEASRGERIGAIQIPRVHCPTLTVKSFSLDTPEPPRIAIALDDTRALVVTKFNGDTGQPALFYEVTVDGPQLLPISMPNFDPASGLKGPNGTIYLGGVRLNGNGEVWAGGINGFPTQISITDGLNEVMEMGMTITGTRAVLYTEGDYNGIDRYDFHHWTNLVPASVYTGEHGAIVWSGTGDEWLGLAPFDVDTPPSTILLHWIDGHLDQIPLPDAHLTGLTRIPSLGYLAGAQSGEIFNLSPNGMMGSMGRTGRLLRVSAFVPFKDGFLFSGYEGAIGAWYPSSGYCPDMLPAGFQETLRMIPLGGQILVTGTKQETISRAFIAIVREG